MAEGELQIASSRRGKTNPCKSAFSEAEEMTQRKSRTLDRGIRLQPIVLAPSLVSFNLADPGVVKQPATYDIYWTTARDAVMDKDVGPDYTITCGLIPDSFVIFAYNH